MIAYILDDRWRERTTISATPMCGEDFCDDCGDCLDCYGADEPGACARGFYHLWIVAADEEDEWREKHGLPSAVEQLKARQDELAKRMGIADV